MCQLESPGWCYTGAHLVGLYVLDPKTLLKDSASREIWLKQNCPFWNFHPKISIFSPIRIWLKQSLKITQKRRVLWKKMIKLTLKYTDKGSFSTFKLWLRCWGIDPNLTAKFVKICVFLEFSKKRKMVHFKSKNLCDESLKIKNLRLQFSCISCWLRRGILRF